MTSEIQTYTGKAFDPISPNPDDICIEDIAHHLSMLCRFTGACKDFYSVAEHSIMVSRLVEPSLKLQALLHDASEAYMADVSRPVKKSLEMAPYRHIEHRLQTAIYETFGCPVLERPEIKAADNKMLSIEAWQLLGPKMIDNWKAIEPQPGPSDITLGCFHYRYAEYMFLAEFDRLTNS